MLQPGLGRATAFGLLGFMTASLLVLIVRSLQSLDPVYDPSVSIVLGGFFAAIFFVWGIGAFNPLWSAHGEAEAEAHEVISKRAQEPRRILTATVWSLLGWLVLMLVLIIVFATLPFGFALTITADPVASTSAIGFVYVTIGEATLAISQLVILMIFIAIIFLSLFIVAWALGNALVGLNRGYVQVSQEAGVKLGASPVLVALPSGAGTNPDPKREASRRVKAIRQAILFVVVFTVLYLLFFYVAIGLIFPAQPWLTILSLVNAVIFTVLLVRPTSLLLFIGWVAAQMARFVRWLPKILFQRG
ncbi:MAG TPA: hypothetical protein VER79_09105 [Candidatus Limnocylindrales bacterium]|nr:hypothetical protein [Candidatus Limnocylindrales bacterium]